VITIGKVARPFGMGGAVKVISLTDTPDMFLHLKRVGLSDGTDERREVDIEEVKCAADNIILKMKGIDTRDDALRLRGQFLVLNSQEVPPLPQDRYYIHDIIGLRVVTDFGKQLGRVRDVMVLESNDVYVVQGERGEILIPAIRDIVTSIDVETGTMIIHPMEGLLD